jgi:PKD repeat protein
MKRVSSRADIMRMSSRLLVSPAMTIAVIAIVVALAIVLLAPNTIVITNAQQQQPPVASQPPAVTQNSTTLFQSTEDGIRLRVPEGWVIQDVNNTSSTLSEESTQGYGILAQLCPQEEGEQEQAAVLSNVSTSGNTATSCQGSEGEVIHIVRYPDLDSRLFANNVNTTNNNMTTTTADNILTYHLQKLQEVGYRSMQIVNSTDVISNVTNAQTNQTIATVPAKFVEMTYNTASATNETRQGYFILTATNATYPNAGTTKGYSVFYEGGNSSAATADTTTSSGSLALRPLAAPVREVFDSFELVAVVAHTEQPLTVQISSNDTEAIAPATFEFEADVGGGTEPYTYSWDFGGEGSSGVEGNEQTVSHTFEEAGSYNVSLTVTGSGGQSASDSIEITVEEEEEEEEPPAEEEEVEEEPIPLLPPPPQVEEEEEQEPIPSPPPADDVAENIEDEVDAFVQELLDRFGVENPGTP